MRTLFSTEFRNMIKINFLGDTAFNDTNNQRDIHSLEYISDDLRNAFMSADFNVVNIEGPLTTSTAEKKKGSVIKSHPSNISILSKLNLNVFNLANNHIMDCGVSGLDDTIRLASESNVRYLGADHNLEKASKPIILRKQDVSVAIISICHKEGRIATRNSAGVFCDIKKRLLRRIIRCLKDEYDWMIVLYHGGEEFTHIPMPSRRRQFMRYIDWGADIVIAHHAHVVQGYEVWNGKFIAYSLGNFLFDTDYQRRHEDTDESVVINLRFYKTKFKFSPIFTKYDRVNGRVYRIPDNPYFRQITTADHSGLWQNECYRVVFSQWVKNYINHNKNHNHNIKSYQIHPILIRIWTLMQNFIRYDLYVSIFRMLKYRNSRSIFIGAISKIIKNSLPF
jgi:hypothetical protein